MPNPRLAARYAKALLDLAVEKGQLDAVYKDMLMLHELIRSNKELANVLKSPVINSEKKDKILNAMRAGQVSEITTTFNKMLVAKNREEYVGEIIHAFVNQYKAYKG